MFQKTEVAVIIITTIILAITLSFKNLTSIFPWALLAVFFAILINVLAKKIISYYLDTKIELKFWQVKRYWFRPTDYFKKPVTMGLILPIVLAIISLGNITWMASIVFDVKTTVQRASRRWGLYTFSTVTEDHVGLIAAAGVVTNLIFALFGYLIGFPLFSKVNIFLAFFNMLPISNLDGNKIYFGSLVLWGFLATLVLIGLVYAFLLP